jgi:cellulose synthase operon protein YhjU
VTYLSLYFLVKVGLYFSGYIGFNWVLNFLLAIVGFWPIQNSLWRKTRAGLVWFLAGLLFYHDSFLPDLVKLWPRLVAIQSFSGEYLWELITREFTPKLVACLVIVIIGFGLLTRWVRFSTFAILAILSVPIVGMLGSDAGNSQLQVASGAIHSPRAVIASSPSVAMHSDAELKDFYAKEQQRRFAFPKTVAAPPFDLIILHVCSLSWDDLDFANARNAPLLSRFDVLFNNFNGASTYSGPSVSRALRGNCGQTPHNQLYRGADEQCYTFPSLAQAGYQTNGLLNHNGVFDSFARVVEREGGLEGRLEKNLGAPVQMRSFDGSPIYDDFALLSSWWDSRLSRGSAPVALYYNTISLHDGARIPGVASQKSIDTYKPRLQKLMSDFDRFINRLESTGRPVVVVLLPEHGASLRWRKGQIDGMREIPDPKITILPAAIKIVGAKTATTSTIVIDQPVSYFGLYSLLGDMMSDSPYSSQARPISERLKKLETTTFVAENEDIIVMREPGGSFTIRGADGTWLPFN